MPQRPKILIVTNGHPCRNPRPVKEAFSLGKAGYEVTLLYVKNHRPSVPLDAALLAGAPFRTACVDMLADSALGRTRALLLRVRTALARRLNGRGANLIAALGPAAELLRAARRTPADLTIVHNEIPHWAGCRLIAGGRRVAADIEDWHSEDLLPDARGARPLRTLRDSERRLLHEAVYCTTTSGALASALFERYGGNRPHVVTNSFPLQPLPALKGAPDGLVRLFWFSQTVGPGRGLEAFVRAWATCRRPSRLVLLGEAAPGYRESLRALAPAERRGWVEFLPLVPNEALPGVIARHDVGLALEESAIPNRDLTITNKILQYLDAGLAVVATPTRGQREVLDRRPDAGLFADLTDAQATAAALDALVSDPESLLRRRAAARGLAEETYCWEREEPRLLSLVEAALR